METLQEYYLHLHSAARSFALFSLLPLSNYPSGNLFYFLKVTCGMHCL